MAPSALKRLDTAGALSQKVKDVQKEKETARESSRKTVKKTVRQLDIYSNERNDLCLQIDQMIQDRISQKYSNQYNQQNNLHIKKITRYVGGNTKKAIEKSGGVGEENMS